MKQRSRLKQAACATARAVLALEIRKTDLIERWGGEEFLAILASDLAGAEVFCERARSAIAKDRGRNRVVTERG